MAKPQLANYSLSNISTLLSYSKISNATGLSVNSLKEYLLYLEQAYLIYQLNFFSYSVKDSISIKMPRKIYCIDNGLRNSVAFTFSEDGGRLAENLTFIELKRRKVEFFYWKEKKEVDFFIKGRDGTLKGINCTYTDRSSKTRRNQCSPELQRTFRGEGFRLDLANKESRKRGKWYQLYSSMEMGSGNKRLKWPKFLMPPAD